MSEETILDTGSQEIAEAAPVEAAQTSVMSQAEPAPAPAQPVAAQPVSPRSWLEDLPEDVRNHPSMQHVPDTITLAKNYVNAQRLIGADKIPVPSKSATEDEWRAVYRKLGAPEDPQQYEVEKTEVFDDTSFEAFRNRAYEVGLNNRQAKAIADLYQEQISTAQAAMDQRAEEIRFSGEQELRQEFGQYFEERMGMAQDAARTIFGDAALFDEIKLADGRLLGDDPRIIRGLVKMREMLGEDSIVGESSELVMSASDARREYDRITAKGSPWYDKYHPEHDRYVQEAVHYRSFFSG
jgi:hypothetical protein